jgi:acetyltransferase
MRRVRVRPVGPGDGEAFNAFVRGLSPAARHNRFLLGLRELTPGLLRLLTQPPGLGRLGLVALVDKDIVGEVRYAQDVRGSGDFAIAVADAWQRFGVGSWLLRELVRRARAAGLERLTGEVASTNAVMLAFARKAGFGIRAHPADARLARVELELSAYSANSLAMSSYEASLVAYSPVMVSSMSSSAA